MHANSQAVLRQLAALGTSLMARYSRSILAHPFVGFSTKHARAHTHACTSMCICMHVHVLLDMYIYICEGTNSCKMAHQ